MSETICVHTLVFDLDDTLFAERDYVVSGFKAVDRWARENIQLEGVGVEAIRLFNKGIRGRVFDEVLVNVGINPTDELVARMVAVYRNHEPCLDLLPDARVALEWASGRFHLALVSDGWLEVQQRKVEALKLSRLISTIILTDVWGRDGWKPSPRAFEAVMHKVPERNPSGFVYIADNPRKDFIAPRNLGWKTVRIRREFGEHACYDPLPSEKAQYEILKLTELEGLFSAK